MIRLAIARLIPLAIAVSYADSAQASVVAIDSNFVGVVSEDNEPFTADTDSTSTTSIPTTNLVLSAMLSATEYATTTINYSQSGSQVVLDHQSSLSRNGDVRDRSQATLTNMFLTVTEDTTYELAGFIQATDLDPTNPGRVYLRSFFSDVTNGVFNAIVLFETEQESRSTTDEMFSLGSTGGDLTNVSSGSLTGNLVAGHTYQWQHTAEIWAFPDGDSGATATSAFTLIIGESTEAAIPEPSSYLVFAGLFAALGLAGWGRRRRMLSEDSS